MTHVTLIACGDQGASASAAGDKRERESVINGSVSSSASTTPLSSRSVSPVPGSSDVHPKHWYQKLGGMKDELDRIGGGFRQAGAHIRTSIDGLFVRGTNTTSDRRQSVFTVAGGTGSGGAKVEIIRDSTRTKKRRHRPNFSSARCTTDTTDLEIPYEASDHNFSMFLMLTDLQDGLFSAEVPMDSLPPGNVRIRVRNDTLEVTVVETCCEILPKENDESPVEKENPSTQATHNNQGSMQSSSPLSSSFNHGSTARSALNITHRGSIRIPIFVNSATLQFTLNEEGTVLHIEGGLKGCSRGRRISQSTNDLRLPRAKTHSLLGVPEYCGRNGSSVSLHSPL